MAPTMRPSVAASLLSQAGRRAYTTQRPSLIASRARWTPRPVQSQIVLRQSFRQQSSLPDAKQVKKGGFRLLRWTWRLTWVSALAGLGYIGYGIYEARNPVDQPPPDASKKTLVVLGMQIPTFMSSSS